MADRELTQILTTLKQTPTYPEATALLSRAKLLLLQLNALTPSPNTPPALLALARTTYEQGALASIRAKNPPAFTRYVTQLRPFYELQGQQGQQESGEQNKVTGLYLLLLLTQGLYGEFHSELEVLSATRGLGEVEGDRYLGYAIRLERWLMEGSYDRMWKAMKKGEVPCEEFGVFSEVCFSPCFPILLGLVLPSVLAILDDPGGGNIAFSLLVRVVADNVRRCRFSPRKSAPKSPRPASAPTPLSRWPRPSRCSSSSPRAPSSSLRAPAAGRSRTARSSSPRRRRPARRSRRRR